jgi:hypothetical protein
VRNLFSGDCLFRELLTETERRQKELLPFLRDARDHAKEESCVGRKTFLLKLLGETPKLVYESVCARFALQQELLHIANAYFRMATQLRYYNIWHTLATSSPARESQLWHRDREDFQILKVFVHLSDVSEGSGPFSYAPGTHRLGKIRREPAYHLEENVRRSTDEQMNAVVPRADWIVAMGPPGTIVFADTQGYHKGGLARECDRVLFTCLYTSPASEVRELFDRSEPGAPPRDRRQALAVQARKRKAHDAVTM